MSARTAWRAAVSGHRRGGGWLRGNAAWMAAIVVLAGSGLGTLQAQSLNAAWHTFDAGGGVSTGAAYVLSGTIGQPDAGAPLLAGLYRLDGGFWPGARSWASHLIFSDGFATGTTAAWSATVPLRPDGGPPPSGAALDGAAGAAARGGT